jgi:predicted nuclease of predicted toxin-antitoxin system
MKILLDESLPRKLKNDFGSDHEVLTVREQGWLGKKNGELLTLMSENKYDLFITVDRNLQYQQNLEYLSITIFVLCAVDNRRESLKKLIPKLFEIIKKSNLEKVIEIS